MTADERRDCLDTIGWTQRELARRLEVDESTIRHWWRGDPMPPRIEAWLAKVAKFIENNPPPPRPAAESR